LHRWSLRRTKLGIGGCLSSAVAEYQGVLYGRRLIGWCGWQIRRGFIEGSIRPILFTRHGRW